ncbi:MAG: TolC family protein [Bacteroidota bacterium]
MLVPLLESNLAVNLQSLFKKGSSARPNDAGGRAAPICTSHCPWIQTYLWEAALVLFLTISAQAQVSRQPIPLKLADCVATALEKNATIRMGMAKIAGAEARYDETGTALLPQLKLSGRLAQLSKIDAFTLPPPFPAITLFPSIEQNYATRISLQQPIFTGFRLKKNQDIAELNVTATREEFSRDQADLVLNVKTAYWNLYRGFQLEKVISQTVDQMTEHLKDIQNYAKQGLVAEVDVMKVNVQLSDIKVKQIEARSNVRLAMMSLNSLLGNPLDFNVEPAEGPAAASGELLSGDLQALIAKARTERPEVKAMLLRKDMGEASVSAAKGGWFPQIMLAANYDYARPNQRIIPPKDQWDGSWDVGLSIQWNIWDWFATGYQSSQAEALLNQTAAGLDQLNDAVALDVAQNYFRVVEAKEKVSVATIGTDQANESYRITSEKFKRGVASTTDLLDSEIALLQAKLTQTQASVDCALALARLQRAVGER